MKPGLFLVLLCLLPADGLSATISDYARTSGWGVCEGSPHIIFRQFTSRAHRYYLAVDPQTLTTAIIRSDSCEFHPMTWDSCREKFSATPYLRALREAQTNSDTLQDAGIVRADRAQEGVSLTVDLCPSRRPLDKILFLKTADAFKNAKLPVPVAISISGLWMRDHLEDLEWLKSLDASGKFSITWVNHSFYHRVLDSVPLRHNFLLARGTNVDKEILMTEKAMIANHLEPSVFFRFPGLVSDRALFMKIISYGLIPVGTDAWLSKNQKVINGSFVLVHANGNDSIGVQKFLRLIAGRHKSIDSGHWLLHDLRTSIAGAQTAVSDPSEK